MSKEIMSQKSARPRGRPSKVDTEKLARVLDLAKEGKSAVSIAAEVGISQDTVLRVLTRNGIRLKHGGRRENAGRRKKDEFNNVKPGDVVVISDTAVGQVFEVANISDISVCVPCTIERIFRDSINDESKDKLKQLSIQLDRLRSQIHNNSEQILRSEIGNKVLISVLELKYFTIVEKMLQFLRDKNKDNENINFKEDGNDEFSFSESTIENLAESEDLTLIFEKPSLPLEVISKSRPEIDKKTLVHMCRSIYSLVKNTPVWDQTLTKVIKPETWQCTFRDQAGLGDYKHYPGAVANSGNYKKKKNSKNGETKTEIA